MNLTFLNGALLFAALAALLPLVIHLISRRRVTTVDFSSLRFLKELERKKIRRVRIRQILLLIIRSLAILFVALALSRPTLSGAISGIGGGHARTSVAVVLDNSASMEREGESEKLFSEAKAALGSLSGLLDEGDQAFLVTAARPPVSLLPEGTFSRSGLTETAGGLEVGAQATDYSGAARDAMELLSASRNLNRELYLLGDMQATGWRESDRRTSAGADSVAVYVLPFSGPTANLAVSAVSVERRYGGTPGLIAVSAEVRNFDRRDGEVQVRLIVDGRQYGQTGIVTQRGASAVARFAVQLDEQSWHSGSVSLESDALEYDDRRYFVVPPVGSTQVLVVAADDDEERDDAYYAALALDPTRMGERFAVSTVPSDALSRQDTERFQVVILADVGRLDAPGAEWLRAHAEGGGGALLVLGDRTDVRFWNAGLLPELAGAEITTPVERRDGLRLAPSSVGHPLLEGLAVGERLSDDVSVRRAFEVNPGAAETVLELPGVGPGLLLRRTRSGAVVAVLTTGLDPAWNDLARSGLVVPLAHRLCQMLAGSSGAAGEAVVGDDLAVDLGEAPTGGVEVELPDSSTVIAESVSPGSSVVKVGSTRMTGVYTFRTDGVTVALGAVNADTDESDLRPLERDRLADALGVNRVAFVDTDRELAQQVLRARRGRELWRLCLYIALALVATEMVLARTRYAGRGEQDR